MTDLARPSPRQRSFHSSFGSQPPQYARSVVCAVCYSHLENPKELPAVLCACGAVNRTYIRLRHKPPHDVISNWIPDTARNMCKSCNESFTLLNRRHHCRACGEIFCEKCSNSRKLLPRYFNLFGPQRICKICVAKVWPSPDSMDMATAAPSDDDWQLFVCSKHCGQLVFKVDMWDHRLTCANVNYVCPSGCGTKVQGTGMKTHVSECPYVLAVCSNGCGSMVRRMDVATHNAECSHSPIPCPQGCMDNIRRKDKEAHASCCRLASQECPRGCGEVFLRKDATTHQQTCRNEEISCPDKCGQHLLRRDLSSHHDKCPSFRFACPNGCSLSVSRREVANHQSTCSHVLESCRLFCGEQLMRKDMPNHYALSCPLMTVACPAKCGQTLLRRDLASHEHLCPMVEMECPNGCRSSVRRIDLSSHFLVCVNIPEPCSMRCGSPVLRKDMASHVACCPLSLVKCEACFGTLLRRDTRVHQQVCPYGDVKCPQESCTAVIKRVDQDAHLQVCPYVLVQCNLCRYAIKRKDIETHLRSTCPDAMLSCQYACGVTVPRRKYDLHVNGCGLIPKPCHACNAILEQRSLSAHIHGSCPEGFLLCPRCGGKFPRKYIERHVSECGTSRFVDSPGNWVALFRLLDELIRWKELDINLSIQPADRRFRIASTLNSMAGLFKTSTALELLQILKKLKEWEIKDMIFPTDYVTVKDALMQELPKKIIPSGQLKTVVTYIETYVKESLFTPSEGTALKSAVVEQLKSRCTSRVTDMACVLQDLKALSSLMNQGFLGSTSFNSIKSSFLSQVDSAVDSDPGTVMQQAEKALEQGVLSAAERQLLVNAMSIRAKT